MNILILGVAVFMAMHIFTSTPFKKGVYVKLGEKGYKGLFSIVSLAGLILIIYGKANADYVHVWNAFPQARHFTYLCVLIAMVLLPAANMKGNIKRFTRHPMLWGIALWSGGHLLVNGDMASLILFGSFFVYALYAMASQTRRGATKQTTKQPIKYDLIVLAAGITTFVVIALAHGFLFGIALR